MDSGTCSALSAEGARCWAFCAALYQAKGAPFCPEFAEASCCAWVLGLVKGFFPAFIDVITWGFFLLMCILD